MVWRDAATEGKGGETVEGAGVYDTAQMGEWISEDKSKGRWVETANELRTLDVYPETGRGSEYLWQADSWAQKHGTYFSLQFDLTDIVAFWL